MKDIKLVALDLDGTLFDNSSRISKRNLTAIRSITDKGIHVVISTGMKQANNREITAQRIE